MRAAEVQRSLPRQRLAKAKEAVMANRGCRRQSRNCVVLFVVCFKNRARKCEYIQIDTTIV